MLIRGIYVVVYSKIIIGMFRYIIIIIYEVPTAREARNARGEAREREILELRAKCHVRLAWLIRRKLCRLVIGC